MTTRNGREVTNITRVGNKLVGFIYGKPYTWNLNGRRTTTYRSKLDLMLEQPRYIAIRNWGGRLSAQLYETKPSGKGIVKVIEVVL